MSIQAMKRALAALEYYDFANGVPQRAADALRAAITEAERQEPICYLSEEWMQYVQSSEADPHAFPVFTTPQPAIPDSYALVPVEPTPEMIRASWDLASVGLVEYGSRAYISIAYKAMLAAAPKPGETK